MFKLWSLCFFSTVLIGTQLAAVCVKCEIIKEANKKLPPPKYEYYDDYLKEEKEEEKDEAEKIDFSEDEKKK